MSWPTVTLKCKEMYLKIWNLKSLEEYLTFDGYSNVQTPSSWMDIRCNKSDIQ